MPRAAAANSHWACWMNDDPHHADCAAPEEVECEDDDATYKVEQLLDVRDIPTQNGSKAKRRQYLVHCDRRRAEQPYRVLCG